MREFWLVDDASTFGGGQRNVLSLAGFIEQSLPGQRVVVVCPAASELDRRCRTIGVRTVGATFPDLSARTVFALGRAVVHLRRVLPSVPDTAIVVSFSLRAHTYLSAAAVGRRRGPAIVPLMLEQDSARRWTARWLLPRSGAIVVIGDNAARAYRERIGETRVRAINNFLPPEEIATASRTPRPPLDGRRPTLGVLARLIPEKGVMELVEELGSDRDGWERLLVAGDAQDDAYSAGLIRRIAEMGVDDRIELIGRVEALDDFFDATDALIVPSVGNEGQPTVIIEALAHGRPVIVRAPIWSEAFVDLPVIPYRGREGLHHALARLREEREEVVSRETLLERFTPERALHAIEAVADDEREAMN